MSKAAENNSAVAQEQSEHFCEVFQKLKTEVHKAFFGQDETGTVKVSICS